MLKTLKYDAYNGRKELPIEKNILKQIKKEDDIITTELLCSLKNKEKVFLN